MKTLKQGNYISPNVHVVVCNDDIVRTSDGTGTGEGLMYWSDGWGGTETGGNS